MKNKQSQKNKLKLKLIPYLAFRAKILRMGLDDLNEFVTSLLEINPFVEEDRTAPAENHNWREFVIDSEDMYSNLIHQFRILKTNKVEKEIGEYIIKSLTREGYLTIPIENIAQKFNVSIKTAEEALKKVQMLEPPGIAARNLPECFILQLENEGPIGPKVKHIITHHIEELAKEKYSVLSKETGLNTNTLKNLREKISHLTAAPGFAFQKEQIKSIIPDLIIKKVGEELIVELNKKFRRNFYINEKYLRAIKENKAGAQSLKEFIDKARWAKETINERDKLLFGIGKFIAEKETDFLKGKTKFPNKYGFEEISKALKSNISVVSRLMQNKYIDTPVGIFPLQFFLQHKGRGFNDEEVKLKLKEIIQKEDKSKPLNDEEISKKLLGDGIEIKRRTVVKYRKILGIPPSNRRKRVD